MVNRKQIERSVNDTLTRIYISLVSVFAFCRVFGQYDGCVKDWLANQQNSFCHCSLAMPVSLLLFLSARILYINTLVKFIFISQIFKAVFLRTTIEMLLLFGFSLTFFFCLVLCFWFTFCYKQINNGIFIKCSQKECDTNRKQTEHQEKNLLLFS